MRDIDELIKAEPEVDIVEFLNEIKLWDMSLEGDPYDEVVHNTLESVVDLIAQYC